MVIAWTGFGLMLVISQRYLNHKYKLRQLLHTISGVAILIMTVHSSWNTIDHIGGINKNPHSIVGTVMIGLTLLGVFSGFVNLVFRNKINYDWDTEATLAKRRHHRNLGYFVLFLAQFANMTGLAKKSNG